jgi:rhamnosyltransferase
MTDLERVQCVIPNNNGMSRGLPELLESLRSQKDVEVQIIVVDSGSIDNSVKYSELMGCTVLHIDPKDFTHANSRNKALDYVDTEYVFYTVNDAFICDDRYLFKALNLIKKYDLAVLSGQQISGQKNLYSQYESMEIAKNFHEKDKVYIAKKYFKNIQLMYVDNVNALYKTEVLKKVRFVGDAVEDMITGNMFYQLGFSVGHTAIVKVEHGHVYFDVNKYKDRVLNDVKCYCPRKLNSRLQKCIFRKKLFLILNAIFNGSSSSRLIFDLSLVGILELVATFARSFTVLKSYNKVNGKDFVGLFFLSTIIIFFIKIKILKLKKWLKENEITLNCTDGEYNLFMRLYLSKIEAIYAEK